MITVSDVRKILVKEAVHLSDEEVRTLIREVERFADFMVEVDIEHQRTKGDANEPTQPPANQGQQ